MLNIKMLNIRFSPKSQSELYESIAENNGKNKKVFNYIFAIFVCILGFIVKLLLIRSIHYPEGGFLISTATIMISAWYGGFGPGLLAVFVNYLIVDWFFITPQALFFQDSFVDQFRISLFLIEGILISWLFELLHRAHQKTRVSLLTIYQNEKRFRSLIENIKDHAIFMVDARGNILTWSEGATTMTGYQKNEVLYKPFSILNPRKTKKRDVFLKDLDIALTKGQYNQEGWKMRKGDSLFWAETIVTALPSVSSKDQKFSIIIHDTTARKKTDELKSELLSIITHELRTPIAIMKVITENFIRNYSQQDLRNETRDLLDLNGEMDRLTLLIENILNLARLKNKKLFLQRQDIELSSLIKRVVSKMQLIVEENRSILYHPTHTITISADQLKIEQVLINLLDNAIKFTPKKGKIEISAKVVKNMAIVSILNESETEIPKNKHLLIFNKFYQLTKQPVKGLGLGLYISREIIKQHKGKMWVSSHAGKENIFSFSLPIR